MFVTALKPWHMGGGQTIAFVPPSANIISNSLSVTSEVANTDVESVNAYTILAVPVNLGPYSNTHITLTDSDTVGIRMWLI